jgi:ribonuclease P protein component
MAKQFTLAKNERLKSRKQIEQLFSEGKKFAVSPFRIFYLFNTQPETDNIQSPLCFGVGVSAKNFKKAVDRNRIKRLMREAWRLQKKELKEKLKSSNRQLNIFFIYTGKELPDYNIVFNKTGTVIKKIIAEIEQ